MTIYLTIQNVILSYCHIVIIVAIPNNTQQYCHWYCNNNCITATQVPSVRPVPCPPRSDAPNHFLHFTFQIRQWLPRRRPRAGPCVGGSPSREVIPKPSRSPPPPPPPPRSPPQPERRRLLARRHWHLPHRWRRPGGLRSCPRSGIRVRRRRWGFPMMSHSSCVSWMMADGLCTMYPTPCIIGTSTSCSLLDSDKIGPVAGRTRHEPPWNVPRKVRRRSTT